jgi:hypothetical protein
MGLSRTIYDTTKGFRVHSKSKDSVQEYKNSGFSGDCLGYGSTFGFILGSIFRNTLSIKILLNHRLLAIIEDKKGS